MTYIFSLVAQVKKNKKKIAYRIDFVSSLKFDTVDTPSRLNIPKKTKQKQNAMSKSPILLRL